MADNPIDRDLPASCRDFDFLLGDWTIAVQSGETVLDGQWRARLLHGGRMVVDDVVIFGAHKEITRSMATLRTWVPSEKRWEAVFVYSLEPIRHIQLTGRRHEDKINLIALDIASDEKATVEFFDIARQSFRWRQIDHDGRTRLEISAVRASEPDVV